MLETILITNDPRLAQDAQIAGVSRVMVDLETIGKKERQASRKTFITNHRPQDIRIIREAAKDMKLIVRINPWHDGSKAEIETAVQGGADFIMLPMITQMDQIQRCAEAIQNRASFYPLLETAFCFSEIQSIAALESYEEAFIGLNDLHLS
ncbi:MAG: aldolase/citrate lyase family protein, partial [Bacteroidota bacterium]